MVHNDEDRKINNLGEEEAVSEEVTDKVIGEDTEDEELPADPLVTEFDDEEKGGW